MYNTCMCVCMYVAIYKAPYKNKSLTRLESIDRAVKSHWPQPLVTQHPSSFLKVFQQSFCIQVHTFKCLWVCFSVLRSVGKLLKGLIHRPNQWQGIQHMLSDKLEIWTLQNPELCAGCIHPGKDGFICTTVDWGPLGNTNGEESCCQSVTVWLKPPQLKWWFALPTFWPHVSRRQTADK